MNCKAGAIVEFILLGKKIKATSLGIISDPLHKHEDKVKVRVLGGEYGIPVSEILSVEKADK